MSLNAKMLYSRFKEPMFFSARELLEEACFKKENLYGGC
jgi:hypothetical protein